ncbi:hypothetical protein Tco_1410578 [Tanacetum coccineum]
MLRIRGIKISKPFCKYVEIISMKMDRVVLRCYDIRTLIDKFDGGMKDTLFMLAMNRLLNGACQVLEGAFGGHGLIPTHAVMKRFSLISIGTETLFGLLKLAVAVAVSLNAGRVGITGFEEEPLLYSKIAVVVVLSNFLVHLHKLVQLCSIELVVGEL